MSSHEPFLPQKKASKQRLDALLVSRELIPSREQASRFILAGRVKVDGLVRDKPGRWCLQTLK
jgi:predicted rRNA methylase YqxC with S4 and FtsJ domains